MQNTPILIAQRTIAQTLELSYTFINAGFTTETAIDGPSAARKALTMDLGLIVLDTSLDGQDGPALCAGLRSEGIETPVVFVSSSSAISDRIQAFRSGADDFITRPFDQEELILRSHALLRRFGRTEITGQRCRVGPSVVNLNNGRASRDSRPVFLTAKELQLLRYLYERKDQIVPRVELLREVWHYSSVSTRTIDVHLSTLRQKLESDSQNPEFLKTIRGRGYMYCQRD